MRLSQWAQSIEMGNERSQISANNTLYNNTLYHPNACGEGAGRRGVDTRNMMYMAQNNPPK